MVALAAVNAMSTTGLYLLLAKHAAPLAALAPDWLPPGGATAFVDAGTAGREAGTDAAFAIEERGTLVGVACLGGIGADGARELRIWVAPPFRRRGFGAFGVRMTLEFAFRNRNLPRVRAAAAPGDGATRRTLERSGFRALDAAGGSFEIDAASWRSREDGPALARLAQGLRTLLDLELAAGNEIRETGIGWPDPDSVFVRLAHPFRARPSALPEGIRYAEPDDPHWWRAEYSCSSPRQILAC